SFQWTLPSSAHIVTGSDTDAGPFIVEMDSAGYQEIRLKVSEYGKCDNTDSVKIDVIDSPEVSFYSKPDVCLGDTVAVALSAATSGVNNYKWNFGDATIIAATDQVQGGPYNLMWTSSGLHVIEMYGMIGSLCRSRLMTDTIFVHDLPD